MLSATAFSSVLRLGAALLLLLVVFAALRRSPKIALSAWLFVVCFVPVWIGVDLIAYFPAFAIISLLTGTSLLPLPSDVHWSFADLLFAAILIMVVTETLFGLTTRSASFDLLSVWASAFIFGRLVTQVVDPKWIYRAFAVSFTVVALFALLEFATGKNLFITFLSNNTVLFDTWGTLQPRGSIIRAEGAFGHSIAMGSSLGIAVAMSMGAAIRPWLKTAMIVVMAAASVVSFSRTGMLTVALSIVLACFFQREQLTRGYRALMITVIAVVAGTAAFFVRDVFLDSGDEAERSAFYRSDLFDLVSYMRPFGLTSNYHVSTTHEVSIGGFGSIDNEVLLFGLVYGWIPLVLIGVLLAATAVYVLRRRATPPIIGIVAQLPAFFTVALITQYAAVVWFTAGLAVGTQLMANSARSARRLVPEHEAEFSRDSRERQLQDYLHTAREVLPS